MLRKLQALSPPFLQRIDHHLLIHYPNLWATRIHQVLFFGGLALGILGLKALITPLSVGDLPDPDTHFGLMMIPLLAFVGLWAVRVYQFKPEKSFAQRKSGHWLKEQLIYGAGILVMLSGPIAYNMILNQRIDHKVNDLQFTQDIFVLDMGSDYYLNANRYPQFGNHYLNQDPLLTPYHHTFSVPAQPEAHAAQIQLLLDTYNRYSSEAFPHSASEVMYAFQNNEGYYSLDCDKAKKQASSNTLIISRIKANRAFLLYNSSLNAFLAMILFVCFAFSVFQQASWKQFLMALGSAAVGGLIIGLASEFLGSTVSATRQDDWAMLIGIGLYGLIFTQIFRNRNTRLLAKGRTVMVLLLALSFPVLFMSFLGWSDVIPVNDNHITEVILLVAAASYFTWNGLYRLRLNKLQASPTKN